MDVEEVLRREKESFELGLRMGVVATLWFGFLAGVVIFTVATLARVWF